MTIMHLENSQAQRHVKTLSSIVVPVHSVFRFVFGLHGQRDRANPADGMVRNGLQQRHKHRLREQGNVRRSRPLPSGRMGRVLPHGRDQRSQPAA